MSTTVTPNLMTENVNQSVSFYCERLGFRFLAGFSAERDAMQSEFSPDTPLDWAMVGRDEAKLMFQSRRSMSGECAPLGELPLGASGTLYIEVADLDSLLSGLGDPIETVLPERVTFYGMRELWIKDNNGYMLVLAQRSA